MALSGELLLGSNLRISISLERSLVVDADDVVHVRDGDRCMLIEDSGEQILCERGDHTVNNLMFFRADRVTIAWGNAGAVARIFVKYHLNPGDRIYQLSRWSTQEMPDSVMALFENVTDILKRGSVEDIIGIITLYSLNQ